MKDLEKKLDFQLTTKYWFIIRLDGKWFSKFTKKNFTKPYDSRLDEVFQSVTVKLMEEYNPTLAYTQSDEITLYFNIEWKNDIYFSGRIQKLVSLLAGKTSSLFLYELVKMWLANAIEDLPCFDARIFEVDNINEVYKSFEFRYFDCLRNWRLNCSVFLPKSERVHKSWREIIKEVKDKCKFDYFSLPLSARKWTFYRKVLEMKEFEFNWKTWEVERNVVKRVNLNNFPETKEDFENTLIK